MPAEPVALFDVNLFNFLEPIAAEGLAAGIAPVNQGIEIAQQDNFMDVFDNLDANSLFENFLAGPIEEDILANLDFLDFDNDLSFAF